MGRRHGMNHSAVLRSELGEGMGHLWQAAGHAPGAMMESAVPAWRMARGRMMVPGMRGTRRMGMRGWAMSPTMGAARRLGTKVAAVAPLAVMAPTRGVLSNRRANRAIAKVIMKKESKSGRRRRAGMLIGLLAAGATAGTAAAMAARRRNRMAWEEYETHGHGYPTDAGMPTAEPMGTAGRTMG
jgi:hypothetical protein